LSPNAPQGTRDYLLPPKTVNYSSPISVIENTISIAPRNTPIPKFATVNTQGSFDFTSISNAEVFNLSSNPFSSKTIHLDFDGYNTSATAWNNPTFVGSSNVISSIAVFSLDSIVSTAYSQAEFDAMKEIFLRVAADYAPFGVNVTTKTPTFDQITRSSTSDGAYGTVVSIGNIGGQWSGAGGIAYVGIYDLVDTTNYYKPALVFPSRLGTAKNIAEAASHEAGHNLNLSHDGQGSTQYYAGGGSSPGWAPIMGVGYSKQLTQFSRGQYSNATNTENDFLQIRGEGIGRYVEGTPNTDLASAQTITLDSTGYGGAFEWITLASDDGNTGIDYDYFKFTAPAAGSVNISVNNALIFSKDGTNFIGEDLPAGYGNLHLDAQILNASGGILADWNNNALVDVTGLTYSGLVAGQNYFVKVGPNSTLPDQSFGETTWGSLGAYALRIQADTNSTKSISIAKTTDGKEAGSVSSVFTLTRTGDLSSALTVNYTLAGTATPGVDYTNPGAGKATFAAGSSKATITLPTKDDLFSDPGETIIITIIPGDYNIIAPGTATATILDNDGNAANNNLVGTSFADALAGVGGNDTINGGLGNDTLDGGADNDTYLFDTDLVLGSDSLIDASGIDTLNFAATTTKTINLNLGSTAAQTVTAGNLTLTLASANAFENVIGGSLNDNIVGNTLANSLTGGLGKDTLTGSTGLDTLNYNSLGESLLSGFDVIQGYSGTGASLDRINAPAPIAPITLNASKGTATALTEAAIQLVLTNAAFAANTAAAFKVTGQSGTFIALNNGAAGFQAASDAIIQLSGYNIAAATLVVVI
jgi:hypothetical protein